MHPCCARERFAIPSFQESLLKKGLGFSDWASARLFRRGHLAPTFDDAELTPFEKFPINGYDVEDPGVIFENWTLTVGGAVQKPGDYKLAQIQSLAADPAKYAPRLRRRLGRDWPLRRRAAFGLSYYDRRRHFRAIHYRGLRGRLLRVARHGDGAASADSALLRDVRPALTRKHGAPLRLNVPTKVGYKQAKYLTDLKVTNVLEKVGYWEDQGYSSFYGL